MHFYKSYWKMPPFILLRGADPVMTICFSLVLPEAEPETKTWVRDIHLRCAPKNQERGSREREARKRGKPLCVCVCVCRSLPQFNQGLPLLEHPERYTECFWTCPPERREAGTFIPGSCPSVGWSLPLWVLLTLCFWTVLVHWP